MIGTVLSSLFTLHSLLLSIAGTLIGIIFGAVPGLSNTSGMALFLPLTFAMSAPHAIIFMGSIYIGGLSGGLITSILLGVPGAAANIATVFDGYPMAKSGKASRALGIGIFSSLIASLASIVIAMLLCRPLAKVALSFGPWEMFSLCACAIVMVVTISKGDMFSGLIAACLGAFIGLIGTAPVDAAKRFTFGNVHLSGGVTVLTVILGIFALATLFKNYAEGESSVTDLDTKGVKGVGISLKEYFSHMKVILQSFFVGLWIGFLPGLGAGLSNIVAYAMAKSGSKTPEKFGKGCEEGIIASEIANNAAVGGAIVPTIAMGIPGDTSCAILISALMMQGINVGPLLMDSNAELVYIFFGVILLSTVITFIMEWFGMRVFPYVLKVPIHYLYAAIFMICITGMFSNSKSLWTCGFMLFLAAAGILMYYAKLTMSPFILGFLLGPMMEKNLREGMTYSGEGFMAFLRRPVSAALLIVMVICLFWPFIRDALEKRKKKSGKTTELDRISEQAASMETESD